MLPFFLIIYSLKYIASKRTDEECLELAKIELITQLRSEKYIDCFELFKNRDNSKNEKYYRWIKTWPKSTDTISIIVFVERTKWSAPLSYMYGNNDLYRKLRMVDMRETPYPPSYLTEEEKKNIEKYKNYKLCK